MDLASSFADLSGLVETLERRGVEVRGVRCGAGDLVADGSLSVTLDLGVSLCDAVRGDGAAGATADATVDADGTLAVDLSVAAPLLPEGVAVARSGVEAGLEGETLVASVPVSVPVDGGPADAAAADREVAGPSGGGPDADDAGPDASDVAAAADGGTADDLSAATDGQATAGSRTDAGGGSDVPVFRDPERLRAAYERCDTFAEMTEALGLDVTAETVRRYMIDAGVHEPTSYDTGSDDGDGDGASAGDETSAGGRPEGAAAGDAGGPDGEDVPDAGTAEDLPDDGLYADGIGLPDGLTVEGLIETIRRSNTLYEVSHDLDVERGTARAVLEDLNLLDLVVGRLAMEAEREVSREEVVRRLREAATRT